MRTLKTNGKELIAVEVPMEATKPKVDAGLLLCIIEKNGGASGTHYSLPKGKFEILGTLTNGESDFDVEPYVKDNTPQPPLTKKEKEAFEYMNEVWGDDDDGAYANMAKTHYMKWFLSLLQSHSIEYANKKLVILLKK